MAQKQPSFKECVTAHLPRARALKIIGAKPVADTLGNHLMVIAGKEVL